MARPKKVVDAEQVRQLAAIQCSVEEIGAVVGCSPDTLQRRFAAVIKEGRENGKSSLKKAQFKAALAGNTSMLIWLGKVVLGQKETQVFEGNAIPLMEFAKRESGEG
jgi:AraC-like DNA-binding protein